MSDRKQDRTVIGTERLQEIRARLDAWYGMGPVEQSLTHPDAYVADIAWLLAQLDELAGRAPLPCGCVMGPMLWVTNCTEGHGEEREAIAQELRGG